MPEPTTYSPNDDYTAIEKGTQLNVEFQDISESTESLAAAIADVRRSDGALQNRIVTEDSLATGLRDDLVGGAISQAAASASAAAGSASAAAGSASAASGSALAAEGSAIASGRPFASRADFLAATIPLPVTRTSFYVGDQTYSVVRDASGPILHPDGSRWAPDGDVTPQHFADAEQGSDDTLAFEAASAFGEVVVPSGTYILDGFDVARSGVRFRAKGFAVLKVKAGSVVSGPLLISATGKSNVKFEGFVIDGNTGPVTSMNNVVQAFESFDIVFEGCTFQNCRGIAVLASASERVKTINCRFINCGILNRTTGLSADRRQAFAATNSPECEVVGCYFESIGLDCISFATNSHRSKAVRNTIKGNDAGSIYVTSEGCTVALNFIQNGSGGGNAIDFFSVNSGTIQGNVCDRNGAAGILLANTKNVSVTGNICKNNWQGGASVHRGGITFSALEGEICASNTLSGNVCFDDQATKTQRFAIGVVSSGTGAFKNNVISRDNRLTGYNAAGTVNYDSLFQSSALGLVGHGYSFNLADGASVALYSAETGVLGEFLVHEINGSHFGKFGRRNTQVPRVLIDIDGTFATTDSGTESAVFLSSGQVFLKNRTGSTKTYYVEGGESQFTGAA